MPSNDPLTSDHLIHDVATLRALYPPAGDVARRKCLGHLDPHARAFIACSPFLVIGTQGGQDADVSPRGDPPGFVEVLDDHTLMIPDRPGNNRLDTLENILRNPSVGLLFLIPGFEETLRVNGTAYLTQDPDLLARRAVHGRAPRLAILVRVSEVYLHCAKALRRSALWDAEARQDRATLPSFMTMVMDQIGERTDDPDEIARLDGHLERRYGETMY